MATHRNYQCTRFRPALSTANLPGDKLPQWKPRIRENHQAGEGWKIAERINLFPAATAQHPAAKEKQWDIRTQTRTQMVKGGKVQAVAAQAARGPESRRRRWCWRRPGRCRAESPWRSGHEYCRASRVPAPTLRTPGKPDCPVPPGIAGLSQSTVIPFPAREMLISRRSCRRDGLVNGTDFVVAVGPFAENFKPGVYLGERAKAKCLWQSERAAALAHPAASRSFL